MEDKSRDKRRDKEFDRPFQCWFNKVEKWSWNGNIVMVLDKEAKIQNQVITQF